MGNLYGSIEAGGTKWVCAVGSSPDRITAEARFATTTPTETMRVVVDFFASHAPVAAIGVCCFGPVELRPGEPKFGFITTTPKPGWTDTDVVGVLRGALGVPVSIDTDVNGAALGEGRWGAGRGLSNFAYLTVGTGVGGGAIVAGRPIHGLVHAEMGHVSVVRHADDDFPGMCPFHGDCFEGMASGPAIEQRWGRGAGDLAGNDRRRAIEMEAHYIASGLRNIVYTLAPERIILGGGVSKMETLNQGVEAALVTALAGYPGLREHGAGGFVVPPGLGDRAGVAGGFVLAEAALTEASST